MSLSAKIFRLREQSLVRACYRKQKTFDRREKAAKVVHDRLIVYGKERENGISEAKDDS